MQPIHYEDAKYLSAGKAFWESLKYLFIQNFLSNNCLSLQMNIGNFVYL